MDDVRSRPLTGMAMMALYLRLAVGRVTQYTGDQINQRV